jgi:tRNA-binding protein
MKKMDVFYNPNGIGDVLIIPIEDGDRYERQYERIGDVAKITAKEQVLGYNLFNASRYLILNETGAIKLTEELVQSIEKAFSENGITDKLDVDLSPKFVVGHVVKKEAHSNADKLSVCQVNIGNETLQIVCGAPNVDEGQKVVVAKPGAVMPGGLKIKPTELRGTPSNGMICSKKELGLPNASKEKGIYVLSDDYTAGDEFHF